LYIEFDCTGCQDDKLLCTCNYSTNELVGVGGVSIFTMEMETIFLRHLLLHFAALVKINRVTAEAALLVIMEAVHLLME
jgi:hypothetical protein